MAVIDARAALRNSMEELVYNKGMLTGLAVCWGKADECASESVGLAREVTRDAGGFHKAPVPIDDDTVYDIASLSKPFTLVAALQLVERGRMGFEDDIARLDARFGALQGCKLIDLLTYEAVLKTPQRVDAQPNLAAAKKQVFLTYRAAEEGAKLYSDMNALVLKYLVEAVSGKPYHKYLEDMVWSPLGMTETWMKVPQERRECLMDYNFEHRIIQGHYQLLDMNAPGLPHDPKARLLGDDGNDLAGHAGIFSTARDMCRFAMGLLSGSLVSHEMLHLIGINRTGRHEPGRPYRQYMGLICFSKSAVERLSEVPPWMGRKAFALSGYTGNHLAIDPELGVFDLFLGNRCHNRVSVVEPKEAAVHLGLKPDGTGEVTWPDGRRVKSSFQYVYQKDAMLHAPVKACLLKAGWMRTEESK